MKNIMMSYSQIIARFFVKLLSLLFSVAIIIGVSQSYADQFFNIAGVNIDHTLDEAGYKALDNYGLRYVRLSFPRLPLMSHVAPYNLDKNALAVFDSHLTLASLSGIKIVVDPHYYPGMERRYSTRPTDSFWGNKDFEDALVNFWGNIAKLYANRGDVIFAYDILNEPTPPAYINGVDRCTYLNQLYERIIHNIRLYDKNRYLLVQFPMALSVSGKPTNQMDGAKCLTSKKWEKVIYSFHMYDPGRFTHQGVNGLPTPVSLYKNKNHKDIFNYLRERLDLVRAWQKINGEPIIVGEFGASIYAGEEGSKYIADLLSLFDEFGWGWFYHSFRESRVWNPENNDSSYQLYESNMSKSKIKLLEDAALRRTGNR